MSGAGPGPSEPDSRLNDLEDKQAIAEVLYAYCAHLDRMDLDTLAALFTADCVVDYGPDHACRATAPTGCVTTWPGCGAGPALPTTSRT